MKTMEFCSSSMLHGLQGNPWNFSHAFSMVFPWFFHGFSMDFPCFQYQGYADIHDQSSTCNMLIEKKCSECYIQFEKKSNFDTGKLTSELHVENNLCVNTEFSCVILCQEFFFS